MLRELWPSTLSMVEIGRQLGCSEAAVYLWAKELALPPRKDRQGEIVRATAKRKFERRIAEASRAQQVADAPLLVPRVSPYMDAEARKRGLSVATLERRILDIVARDRMVQAVLDDNVVAA